LAFEILQVNLENLGNLGNPENLKD